jgi:folylpolyglutamate synthase/dihydrofolate synthase
MLTSILHHSGYKVGTYTSPHILSLGERITLNSIPTSDTELEKCIDTYKTQIEAAQVESEGKLTHFEILTALAFKHFQDAAVDVAVVEAGLGGARDATNVIPPDTLAAAVIASIGRDHIDALGGSIESIAAAKSGIIKTGRPVVLAPQQSEEAREVVMENCQQHECKDVYQVKRGVLKHNRYELDRNQPIQIAQFDSVGTGETSSTDPLSSLLGNITSSSSSEVKLSLVGDHQLDNAAVALTTAAVIKSNDNKSFGNITLSSALQGLSQATLPGRFQLCQWNINNNNKTEGEEDVLSPWVVLDGAHTPESISSVGKTIQSMFSDIDYNTNGTSPIPVAVVLAMADDKDHIGFMKALQHSMPTNIRAISFTQVAIAGGRQRAAAPGALLGAWMAAGSRQKGAGPTRTLMQASMTAAAERAVSELRATRRKGVLLVTGSFHAVSAALQQLPLVK